MTATPARDPRIAWRVLLAARVSDPPDAAHAWQRTLDELNWPAEPPVAAPRDELLARLTRPHRAPARLGVDGAEWVLAVDHDLCDGLSLVRLLARMLDRPVEFAARGSADRPPASGARLRRLAELGWRPPAGLNAVGGAPQRDHDVLARLELPHAGSPSTAALVHAAAQSVGGRRHVAVGVGTSLAVGDTSIGDHSGFLRLTDVEKLDADQVAAALRAAPLQPVSTGLPGPVSALLLRGLASRLGSTFLVSHLGRITLDGVESLEFYPVTGGGTGVSIGACALGDGPAMLTARARGTAWNTDGLQQLLEAIGGRIGTATSQ